MSAMCEVPVEVVDEMNRIEARVAFLSDVFQVVSERPEDDLALSRKGLEGLFYWTHWPIPNKKQPEKLLAWSAPFPGKAPVFLSW